MRLQDSKTPATRTLSHRDLYLYDTEGFLRVPALLSSVEIEEILSCLRDTPPQHWQNFSKAHRWDFDGTRHPLFAALSRDSRLVDRAFDVVNQPMRLVDCYALRYQPGGSHFMHGGNVQDTEYAGGIRATINRAFRTDYHDGRLYTSIVKALIYLDTIDEESGPFCYVKGSHKANFPFPWRHAMAGTRQFLSDSSFPGFGKVLLQAGDMILLNESLLHGAMRTRTIRHVIAFAYAPAFMPYFSRLIPSATKLQADSGYYDLDYEPAGDQFEPQPGSSSLPAGEQAATQTIRDRKSALGMEDDT